MRCLALAMAVFVLACRGSSTQCTRISVTGGETRLPVFVPGDAYEGFVGTEVPTACVSSEASVTGAVVDEQNIAVDSQWTIERDPFDRVVARLQFTPMSSGPFHVTAQFNPDISRVQHDLVPAITGVHHVVAELPMPAELDRCSPGHVMPNGTVICVELVPHFGADIRTVIDGGITAKLRRGFGSPFQRVTFAGGAMWLQASAGIERWIDDGGLALAQRLETTEDMLGAATESRAYGITKSGMVVRYDLDAGTLDRTALVSRTTLLGLSEASMSDGESTWWGAGSNVCLFPTEPGDAGRCFDIPPLASMLGTDRLGVWFMSRSEVSLLAEGGTLTTTSLSGYEGSTLPLLMQGPGDAVLASPYDGGLRLDLIAGDWLSGWVDGDRLLMLRPGKLVILER